MTRRGPDPYPLTRRALTTALKWLERSRAACQDAGVADMDPQVCGVLDQFKMIRDRLGVPKQTRDILSFFVTADMIQGSVDRLHLALIARIRCHLVAVSVDLDLGGD